MGDKGSFHTFTLLSPTNTHTNNDSCNNGCESESCNIPTNVESAGTATVTSVLSLASSLGISIVII